MLHRFRFWCLTSVMLALVWGCGGSGSSSSQKPSGGDSGSPLDSTAPGDTGLVSDSTSSTDSSADTTTPNDDTGITVNDTGPGGGDACCAADSGEDTGSSGGDSAAVLYTVGGTVTGLVGTVVLQDNGGNNLSVSANGAFSFSTGEPSGTTYAVTILTQPTNGTCSIMAGSGSGTVLGANVTSVVVTCSVGDGGGGPGDAGDATAFDAGGPYTVGGSVSGLSGTVVLQDNGGNNLSVSANGSFVFTTAIASGAGYAVTVLTQPSTPVQTCVVAGGTGTIGTANVTSVTVTCSTTKFTVGGTITGLAAGGSLVLQDNSGDNLTQTANGSFTFATSVASGAAYAVTVLTQPSSPAQTCTVVAGAGTVANANVTNVAITCGAVTFTVGGTVIGLTAGGLVLQDNGSDNKTIASGATTFTFATPLSSGAAYAVTVLTQPAGLTCNVSAGTGTVGSGNVTSVVINCSSATYTIGGSVSGLQNGDIVRLLDNGGDADFVVQNGTFAFATPLASGAAYAVTVGGNPTTPNVETCTVSNGSGTVAAANVTTITVTCVPVVYAVGGTVTGLLAGQSVTLTDNGGNATTVTGPSPVAGQTFTFSQTVGSGLPYNVVVSANPTGPYWEVCTVAGGSGTVTTGPVTTVAVTCSFGNGSTGAPPTGGSINGIASTVTASAGSSSATLGNNAGFQSGQLVLLHQTQGAGAGTWELNTVTGTTANGVSLLQPLGNGYTSGAQILVVPEYSGAMTVSGTLTAPAWNGSTGGILAFADNSTVTVTGQVNMSGQGFRGGGFSNTAANCDVHCTFGIQGESALGVGTNGANSSGALQSNGAGGGGGGAGQDCGNGAGGAYGGAGTVGVNNAGSACGTAADGNSQPGVTDGTANLTGNLLFGGGGGEGGYDEDGDLPGNGGSGGGIILIFANTLTVSGGTLVSNGAAGGNGTNTCPFAGGANGSGCGMGGGGGGAGGAIQITATTVSLGTNLVGATGSSGGLCTCGGTEQSNSGAGGVGRVGVKVSGASSGTSNPAFTAE